MAPLDLLHVQPPGGQASRRRHEILTFCFARGESEERLVELCAPILSESTFSPSCFCEDLFLDELVEGCFEVRALGRAYDASRGFHKRLLTTPPSRESAELRQKVLAELLERTELTAALERAYQALRTFRASLAGTDAGGGRISHLRRRIEILTNLRAAVSELKALGELSRSPLGAASRWVTELESTEHYQRLTYLLDFEDQATVLESRLQLGFDGSLRRFEIVGVSYAEHRRFSSGRFARLLRRLVSLLKGYRFSDEDVMSQLLDQVFSDLEDPIAEVIGCSLQLEFYLAALGFRRFCAARGREVCLPRFCAEGAQAGAPSRRLLGLFNPWLLIQGVPAVPCDETEEDARVTVIITGPNSGGKTRFLQALAISQLLGQVGCFVPAREAELAWVDQMFLSLIERPEPGQTEGRLGMELMRIRHVFETSGPRSMIIMDELCSGTNPSEGTQIFDMVLGLLDELRPQVLISTHFLDFASKLSGQGRPHLRFLQVELGPRDVPSYQFIPGVARTSLARNTAARLGVTRDELLGLVEAHKRRGG